MDHGLDRALVRTILEHASDYPWRLAGIGLLALRLADCREHRLHVWAPDSLGADPPIHDHPYDFTSSVVIGEMTNTRYVEDPAGDEYRRERYSPGAEDGRRSDTVRLVGTSTVFGPGDQYRQLAAELHDSRQAPGTVTIIRCEWHDRPERTVCRPEGAPWVSEHARPATASEVMRITTVALDQFGAVRASV
ncbi:hypothetical protein BH10ACT3_BH10ACT3_24520 [soil metagenome]